MDHSTETDFYSFPPFFTLQPVDVTRDKQIKLWRRLILEWFEKNSSQDVLSLESFELFENKAINRKLDSAGREAIAKDLLDSGHGSWHDVGKTLYVYLKTPSEWATIIYEFAQKNGLTDTIYTLYEIHSGDLTRGTPIQGIEPSACLRALEVLQASGKAQVYTNAEAIDETGVKFI
mmetsp:Transcript_8380/g.14833  ORF Transcript_8380/g.14833 Transcript_8380/m.14833 type:complete len:176 (-) Transcript_8380:101-628(-)